MYLAELVESMGRMCGRGIDGLKDYVVGEVVAWFEGHFVSLDNVVCC
jgi:hypothetical protein